MKRALVSQAISGRIFKISFFNSIPRTSFSTTGSLRSSQKRARTPEESVAYVALVAVRASVDIAVEALDPHPDHNMARREDFCCTFDSHSSQQQSLKLHSYKLCNYWHFVRNVLLNQGTY